jgi:transketolase
MVGKRLLGRGGRVVVMTGDGELQEGQNFEGLQAAAAHAQDNFWVVVDRNELQSDKPTDEILALGDLETKLRAFGWHVASCDGHDHEELARVFADFRAREGVPQALIANTIKGKGVSFMEHPRALREGGGTYRWHAGAPDDESFARAHAELIARIRERLPDLRLLSVEAIEGSVGEPESGIAMRTRPTDEYVAAAYGEELLALADRHPELVVLDADLASDCIRPFELAHPGASTSRHRRARTWSRRQPGWRDTACFPVVNSFAAFLAARANEQIYNQASEGSKVVCALHYAGLIPAGPGKSHQSIRDVSLLGALPNVAIVQPGNADETRALLRWAVADARENVAIRLAIGRRHGASSSDRRSRPRRRAARVQTRSSSRTGRVMLHEALTAAELLGDRRCLNMPWLNRIDGRWLAELVEPFPELLVLEDHAPVGALGDALRRALPERAVTVFGVEGWPACGTPQEALRHHGLDGASLADRIAALLPARTSTA